MNLAPVDSTSLIKKVSLNMISTGDDNNDDDNSCILINISRVNHDCIGNSTHWYIAKHGLMLLIADHSIVSGTEITFSYSNKMPHFMLKEKWNIECNCIHFDKLTIMESLANDILLYGSNGQVDKAIDCAIKLLKYYDEYQFGPISYSRTYYDLFSLSV
jgi:hypothetical protein